MLMCEKCGRLIEEEELGHYYQFDGFLGDEAIIKRMTSWKCDCGGEFCEAIKCEVCGKHFLPEDEDYKYDVCDDCMTDYETTKIAIAIGDRNKESVKINGFIAETLTEDAINKILTDYARKNFIDRDKKAKEYCEEDKMYFSGFITDYRKKGGD